MTFFPTWISKIPAVWRQRAAIAFGAVLLVVSLPWWWSGLNALADLLTGKSASPTSEEADAHEEHNHGRATKAPAITLSETARANIGLKVMELKLQNYAKSITVPALITERPGETRYKIAAPLTGIVTGLSIVPGQMVASSDVLFTLRLTHEDLVKAQKEFLDTLGKLDVERRELERRKEINTSVMSRKLILDKEYEIELLEASLEAQRSALQLHSLSAGEIAKIETERKLIREITLTVPFLHEDLSLHGKEEGDGNSHKHEDHEVLSQDFLVQHLDVHLGESVETGQTLCELVNYQNLFIEGRAFEQDADAITEARNNQLGVDVILEGRLAGASDLQNLPIERVSNEVETDSRALHFYVKLTNHIEHRSTSGQRQFVTWRFKPGQRLQLKVPVQEFKDVIVLPVEAIASEGVETFVFVENGKQFERRKVRVLYRDQENAVIANDGKLSVLETVAKNSAHQLLMALKNQAGGGVDPHAGHMH